MSGKRGISTAIAFLRAGRPVHIVGATGMTVTAVETTSSQLLELRDPPKSAPLMISGARAAALNLANQRNAADPRTPVIISRATWLDQDIARSIVDPGLRS